MLDSSEAMAMVVHTRGRGGPRRAMTLILRLSRNIGYAAKTVELRPMAALALDAVFAKGTDDDAWVRGLD